MTSVISFCSNMKERGNPDVGAHARYQNDGAPTLGYHVACCLPGSIEDAMYIDVKEALDTVCRVTIRPTTSVVTLETIRVHILEGGIILDNPWR